MKLSAHSGQVPVYTVSGADTARPLPEWLIRKRKRSLKNDPEFANRIELLQDFSFEEASQCVRVSPDGNWLMSTGTYKPAIHVHNLNQLALSFERHTNNENVTFQILSSDFTKSLHLQGDRTLDFHTGGGIHYSVRVPRFGRDLLYDANAAEALVPSVGVNAEGSGEVFRLNLEVGRFMKSYEVDVGGDDMLSVGAGALQGGINAGSVNTGSIAEESHNLLAFGTSLGTVEFWDSRSRNRVGILSVPRDSIEGRSEITALQFHRSGLELATGNSNGITQIFDLRSPVPLLSKDQGYGEAIKRLIWLESGSSSRGQIQEPRIMSADKKIIKIWDPRNGDAWTSVEPAVDLNHVEWVKDSGMFLTANEGKQQHAFFIPQLGPAPKWCAFMDNFVEEMAEDPDDPNAFGKASAGDVYDNFKFLTLQQLRQLNLDHLVGQTSLLRPYMHGFFVAQKLYEEARLISNPDVWQEQRAKSIQEKITKERESRIRGNKKATVKVNRKLAERIMEREEKNERRRAKRVLEKGGDDDMVDVEKAPAVGGDDEQDDVAEPKRAGGVLSDPRFARLFQDEDFEVDEASHEFQMVNPSTKIPKGLTAVEDEDAESRKGSSDESSEDEQDTQSARKQASDDKNRISSSSYKKSGHNKTKGPQMVVSSSNKRHDQRNRDKSFGSRVSKLKDRDVPTKSKNTIVVGEREITFAPEKKGRKPAADAESYNGGGGQRHDRKDRRSASNNVFRKM
ncbi:WD40 repeat-like protein [Aaosphaeria arxii CBS 175.79]|uniref:WD40 repeat-like protein n=1 Tax=Aaosphaeria arxii CBS 175.79 TaxID=1450172 RepID=A0A6A5X8V3_9PLEO|nr:WD40 repeat-like protein [Aaosphaeria arxii CBS 175.79]KAF2009495.1 WD40 repeat-like protein [Aaosphaeria arxii CBS 175.79]